MLYIPVSNFSVMLGQYLVFLGCTSTKQRIKCLAQGHYTVALMSLSHDESIEIMKYQHWLTGSQKFIWSELLIKYSMNAYKSICTY